MLRGTPTAILGIVAVSLLAACSGAPRTAVSGRGLAGDAAATEPTGGGDFLDSRAPTVPIRATSIRLVGDEVDEFSVVFDASLSHHVLSSDEHDALREKLRELPESQLNSVSLAARSGVLERSEDVEQESFVIDWELMQAASGQRFPRPTVGVVNAGGILEVRAEAEGASVRLSHLQWNIAEIIGVRECSAELKSGGTDWEVAWREPAVLLGEPTRRLPEGLRLRSGEALLVRLQHQIIETPARVRRSEHVRRVDERRLGRAFHRGNNPQLDRTQYWLLLTAAVLESRSVPPLTSSGSDWGSR